MTRHTPGPWKLDENSGDYRILGGPYAVQHLVAEVMPTKRPQDGLATANARLIAAAPEMKDAIESALHLVTITCNHTVETGLGSCPNCKARWTLEQALHKAVD